jgi:TonB family protein
MIALLVEAAVRATMLGLVAHAALSLLNATSHTQKTVWTAVLLGSAAMPLLQDFSLAPALHAPQAVGTILQLATTTASAHGFPWAKAASALYCVVTTALLLRFIAGLAGSWQIRKSAKRLVEPWTNNLDVRISGTIGSPGTFGSTVLLPGDCFAWNHIKRAAVIAHEAAHVQECDCYLLWLARMYTCFFWFNPAAWWLQRRMAALAESTSDAAAIALIGDRITYAEILLEFGRGPQNNVSLATSMASTNISDRINDIISSSNNPRRTSMKVRIGAFAALLPAVILVALPLKNSALAHADALSGNEANAQPRIVNYGGLVHLADYYPADAKKLGIEGVVVLAVMLDSAGRATDTQIISEEPREMGFGAAASAAAHTIEYSNPTGQPTQMTFQVRFALKDDKVSDPSGAGSPAR